MGKRRWTGLGLAAAAWLTLSGCENDSNGAHRVSSDVYSAQMEGAAETEALAEQLRQENARLRETLAKQEAAVEAQPEKENWRKSAPEIAAFSDSAHEWTSIAVLADGSETVLDDPRLMEYASHLFAIQGTADYTNGAHSDIDPFALRLTEKNGQVYVLNIVNRESVEFPEYAPGLWYRVSPEVANLGKGWMKRPDYVPEESLASRLLNSGVMRVAFGDGTYYFAQSYRVRRLAVEFLQADKKLVKEAGDTNAEPSLEATFYLYGKEIEMKAYPQSIELRDGEERFEYEVGEETVRQMLAFLSAG
ncbi:hypothetical protein [Cohnella fermenti]|uniref:Lipoprotein n=1 Tax=Cohnella fermenti TaxID=2565925 RepID=A0A4S4BH20_9BACL|nr:hypothetical protein [Cohnella fermenti]THF73798.1 hypothetical protein E6C55_27800 [Cohnella fermenti]